MKEPRLGEFELIARLAERLPAPASPGTVGIGDDAAAVPCGDGVMLLTCDVLVAGRHFLPGLTPMTDLGWKAATASVSDIAACGGKPGQALISLGVPDDAGTAALEGLYIGLAEAAAHYGFEVLGGNVSAAGEMFVDCFMVGRAPRFIARGGAAPGHLLAVSGPLGDSDAGLLILREGAGNAVEETLLGRHLRPRARTDLVDALQACASAAIDVSDSLSSELHHLATAGGVRLEVEAEAIPLSEELRAFAAGRGEDPLQRALFGGEEYQLLFALPQPPDEAMRDAGVRVIGRVAAGEGVFLSGAPLPRKGWDHLR